MSKCVDNVPQIRFPGFTVPWEQRNLGDIIIKGGSGGTPSTSIEKYYTGKIPFLCITDISNSDGYIYDTEKHITEDALDASSAWVVPMESVSLAMYASVGKVAILKCDAATSQAFYNMVIDDLATRDIVYQYLKKMESFDEWRTLVSTGTQANLNAEKVKGLSIAIPRELAEQKKLGDFFACMDKLISLHQQKYEELKTYKNGLLQQLFPQSGELFPRFRFPGFTAPWEQYKLGDLYSERNEKGNDFLQILSVSIHTGVSEGELDSESLGKNVRRSEDKTKYKHVYSGDLIFNMMRAWQGAIGVAKNEGMISPAYISAIPNQAVFPLFMDYALRRKEAISQINDLSYGVTDFRKRLYWGSFTQVTCSLPSVEEQKRIWSFLNEIDNAISLQKRKYEELKKYKKALLKKMLV